MKFLSRFLKDKQTVIYYGTLIELKILRINYKKSNISLTIKVIETYSEKHIKILYFSQNAGIKSVI